MCEGRRPADAARPARASAELRRREAAAELQRRLEQTYGKRRRLVEEAHGRIHEIRARLLDGGRHEQQQQHSPAEPEPDPDPDHSAGGAPSSSS